MSSIFRPTRLAVLAAGLVLTATAPAAAHTRSASLASWSVERGHLRLELTLPAIEASRLAPAPGTDGLGARAVAHIASAVTVRADGHVCIAGPPHELAAAAGFVRVERAYRCPPERTIEITDNALFDIAPSHVRITRVHVRGGASFERLLSEHDRTVVIDPVGHAPVAAHVQTQAGLSDYVELGIGHIASGPDHVAFLLALLLLCAGARELALAVTGFTLGHSVSLAIATFGVVHARPPIIEALIGFTVAIAAAERLVVSSQAVSRVAVGAGAALAAAALYALHTNATGVLPAITLTGLALFTCCYLMLAGTSRIHAQLRPALAVVFGLIHGFGFAGALAPLDLPAPQLARALFGFNVGVEIGQLAIVAVALAAWTVIGSRLVTRRPTARAMLLDGASAALCALGLFWFVGRALAT